MWFLRGRPTCIKVLAVIKSIACGYQQVSYRFKVAAEPETLKNGKIWIGIAVPWAPHKENGGFQLSSDDLLALLVNEQAENQVVQLTTIDQKRGPLRQAVQVLTMDEVQLHKNPRALKRLQDIELVHVQELGQWYLDDIGIITCWAEPDKWYQINYTHKIAADSCLFLPTRLPTIISSRKPEIDYKLWVVNGMGVDLPKHLIKEQSEKLKESLDYYTFKEWDWDEDTRIHTDNWESSDDEWESSEEN